MDQLSLRGTHWEMGFQWGARLAERGRFLLDHVPFPLTAERRAFAAACRPAYARHFPAALEGLAGLAAGQGCPREDLETVIPNIGEHLVTVQGIADMIFEEDGAWVLADFKTDRVDADTLCDRYRRQHSV